MKNKIVIQKIIGYIDKIMMYTKDMKYEDFSCNDLVVEACVFNLSQLGELSNKLDLDFQKEYPEIPWKQLYGLRNRIVHDYEGVNLKLVWEIISDDLPELKNNLGNIVSI